MSEQPFRILIAPACFKGSLSAQDTADVMRAFLSDRLPDSVLLDVCPIADGGDDTLSVLRNHDPVFQESSVQVTGPLPGQRVTATYLVHPQKKLLVIEAAQAHGLRLLPQGRLMPMEATSYGVGELVRAAMKAAQPDIIVVTVGGSASTDGGVGALQALGVIVQDAQGRPMAAPIGGGQLSSIQRVVWPQHWPYAGQFLIATDVVNPLLGSNGAAAVFAPQKGADSRQCQQLEAGLAHFSRLMTEVCQMDCSTLPGVGAAGGLAFGLRHLPRSGIISGSQWIAEQLDLPDRIHQTDLIITGEGRFDATSFSGKATGNVLVWADEKPVMVFCGQVQESLVGLSTELNNVEVYPLVPSGASVEEAMADPKAALLRQLEQALPQMKAHLP
ncbi:MAG: glycerate kinase [Vampirovibrio sp.]|jgi:glycerate kinase|nr:glycerate kinase [Vampirovibrio sp.]